MSESKQITQEFEVQGMDCADCAVNIEKEVNKLPGIKTASVDFINARLKVEFDAQHIQFDQVKSAVKHAGYRAREFAKSQQSTLIVEGMDCADESRPIENRLSKIDGIEDIQFNLLKNELMLQHSIPVSQIQEELKELGFTSRLKGQIDTQESISFWQKHRSFILTALSGIFICLGLILQFTRADYKISLALFIAAILSGGFQIAQKGLKEARNLRLGMNFLMSLAVIGAMFIGEWTEAAMVVFLFALAQLLETYSMNRARKSIQSLMELAPNTALLKTPQGLETVPVDEVDVGAPIIIKPGVRIPLDGIVSEGFSTVNQAPITGESKPIEKTVGNEVFAGTINHQGSLEVQVTQKATDSVLARIIRLVEQAQAQKAPTQSFVEKFARYYTPAVVSIAVLVAIVPPLLFGAMFTEWFYRALVLLVISCPCALVISTPVTIVSGLANAARNGVLIKGGVFLENFNKVKALAFDKTGTLTLGKPVVQQIIALNNYSENDILKIAASLESRSEHPIGLAIVEYAKSGNIQPVDIQNFQSLTGKGVRAEIDGSGYVLGNHRLFEENGWCEERVHRKLKDIEKHRKTAVMVGNEHQILGIIAIGDEIRQDTAKVIQVLHEAGIPKIVMLTGDNQMTAEAIAKSLNIDDIQAELLPADKVTAVKNLTQTYDTVAMVGDGINDAPALATANIGISMGASGSDTALETADIALMKDDLSKLTYLKKHSHKTVNIIKQNIFVALFLKVLFFGLAIPGLATLWMAVFADMGASLMVIFNGLRALKTSKD